MYSWNRSHQDGFTVTASFQRSSSRDLCRFPRMQIMAFKRVVSQRRLSTLRFSAWLRTMPFGVPIKCSSVLLSPPSQTLSSHAGSNLLTSALVVCTQLPLQRVRLGFFWKDSCRIFSYAVVELCRLLNRVNCHAACRGDQASIRLSTLIVIPEFSQFGSCGLQSVHVWFVPSVLILRCSGDCIGVICCWMISHWWVSHRGTF